MLDIRKGNKYPCPKCGGEGMVYPSHPHAFGYKDSERVKCRKRKCGAVYKADKYEAWYTKRKP